MSHSPEILRAARLRTAAVLATFGSLALALHGAPEQPTLQAKVVEAAAVPPQIAPIPETTTIPTTTTLPERAVRVRASRNSSGPRLAEAPHPVISGDKVQWMAAAGIVEVNYPYVDYIMTRESHWTVDDVSPNGCIGLGQNCADKNGYYWLEDACPDWQSNPVCQLQRFEEYAVGKYGGWEESYAHWQSHGSW